MRTFLILKQKLVKTILLVNQAESFIFRYELNINNLVLQPSYAMGEVTNNDFPLRLNNSNICSLLNVFYCRSGDSGITQKI